jgi:hypothetical protein
MRALPLALVATAGCDAGPVLDLPDAPVVADADPAAGFVRVTVLQEDDEPEPGQPVEGARIAFVDDYGVAAIISPTDAAGRAAIEHRSNTHLIIARPGRVYVMSALAAGDEVMVGAPAATPAPFPGVAGLLQISFAPFPGAASAYTWDGAFAPCIDAGVSPMPGRIEFAVTAGCDATPRDLVITAHDTTGAAIGWLRVPAVGVTAGVIDATAATWDPVGVSYVTTVVVFDDVNQATVRFTSPASWHVERQAWSRGTPTVVQHRGPRGVAPTFATAIMTSDVYLPFTRITPVFLEAPSVRIWFGAETLPPTHLVFEPAELHMFNAATGGVSSLASLLTVGFDHRGTDGASARWTIYGRNGTLWVPRLPAALTSHDLDGDAAIDADVWRVRIEGVSYNTAMRDFDLYRGALEDGDPTDLPFGSERRRWYAGGRPPRPPCRERDDEAVSASCPSPTWSSPLPRAPAP